MQKANRIFRTGWAVLCLAAMVSVLMLSFTGCGNHPVDPSSNVLDASDSSDQSQYPKPEGTAIRWAIPQITSAETHNIIPTEEAIYRFNQELSNRGYNFYLELVPISIHDDYYGALHASSFDIAHIGIHFVSLTGSNPFYQLIREGYLAPLDEYLALPEFQELKELYHENQWQSVTANGSVYALPFSNGVLSTQMTVFNRTYFTEEDLEGFDGSVADLATRIELPAVQERIQQQGSSEITPIISSGDLHYSWSIVASGENYFGVYLPFDGIGAKNPLEADSVLNNLRAVNQLFQNNHIRIATETETKNNAFADGDFVVHLTNGTASSFSQEDFIVFESKQYLTSETQRVNGIVAASEHKKEALQLLQLVHTDATIANLLTFGVEGTDYQVKNGIACDLVNNELYATRRAVYGTYMACIPCERDTEISYDHKAQSQTFNSSLIASPYLGKHFDTVGYERIIMDLLFLESTLVDQAMNTEIDEYEEVLQQTLQQYKDAGIDELVAAVNEQLGIQTE